MSSELLERANITFPKDHIPETMEFLLGDLLVLSYERGQVAYSYPHPLPESYWQRTATVIADGVEIARAEGNNFETFFQLGNQ